ncbi:MAG TPA: hypothetical protein VLG13_03420 [Patescibacteria group bacterium]|nr:hypothetical protein [Patescibacteria group bacterium]
MAKINKHIEIVRSGKVRLSSMSQPSADALLAVLVKHYERAGITTVNNLSELEALAALRPDLVFLTTQFIPINIPLGVQGPDKLWITDYLEERGIAYTGSSRNALELQHNKPLAKQRVQSAGLKTSPYYVIKQHEDHSEAARLIEFPIFIKPTDRGGGLGIDSDSVVHTFDALRSKVNSITANLKSDALLEQYLPGREFSVAVLKDEESLEFAAMPLELVAEPDNNGRRFLGKEVKSSNTERIIEVTDESLKSQITTLALDVFCALGARDYGRIDIRLDEHGTPHFLEANLIPCLISGYGSFPKACVLNTELHYEAMVLSIVRLGLARNMRESVAVLEPVLALSTALPSLIPV